MSDTIIYFKNGIGNLIMHSPAIQALASMDSTGKVDYCLDSEWKDSRVTGIINILENWDIINDIIFYPKQNIKKKYKLWFYTMHSEGSKAWDLFRQHKLILNKINWRESMLHETEYYMNIVRKLGYKGPTPKKYVPMADEPMIKKNGKKVVGFCGGYFPTQYWHKKGWPYFKDCVKTLKLYYKIDTVKIGIKNELKDIACDYDYVNKLSFVETAKVISQLDLLITTDTSCMHVAHVFKLCQHLGSDDQRAQDVGLQEDRCGGDPVNSGRHRLPGG